EFLLQNRREGKPVCTKLLSGEVGNRADVAVAKGAAARRAHQCKHEESGCVSSGVARAQPVERFLEGTDLDFAAPNGGAANIATLADEQIPDTKEILIPLRGGDVNHRKIH